MICNLVTLRDFPFPGKLSLGPGTRGGAGGCVGPQGTAQPMVRCVPGARQQILTGYPVWSIPQED